ncbi:MAG: hypothetical protein AAFP92_25625, partial [Bacteroidota bacterium]
SRWNRSHSLQLWQSLQRTLNITPADAIRCYGLSADAIRCYETYKSHLRGDGFLCAALRNDFQVL